MKHQFCFQDISSWCTACLCCDYVLWLWEVLQLTLGYVAWVLKNGSDSRNQKEPPLMPCFTPSTCLAQKLSSKECTLFFCPTSCIFEYVGFFVFTTRKLRATPPPPSLSSSDPVAWVFGMSIICILLLFYPSFSFTASSLPYCWPTRYIHLIKKGCLKSFLEGSLISK